MAKFIRANFQADGDYVTYQGKFVARFKHGGKRTFLSFLVKHFDTDEYFNMLETIKPGYGREYAPAEVLETKGYINDNVKRALKRAGYPLTLAAFHQYIADQAAARKAAKEAELARFTTVRIECNNTINWAQ